MHALLNVAVMAARRGGAVLIRHLKKLDSLKVEKKGRNDFVSEADRAAERAVIEVIQKHYPDHAIEAEESGRQGDSDHVWIIDPLDGTTNFIHGLPIYAVSIALAHRGVVQQGVVYDPCRNDLFFASRGRGAFLNDRRLRVSKRTRMTESLIGTGFPFRRGDNYKRYLQMFEAVMPQCAGVRRPGAAALDLCYVAAGYYDGFFETGLNPWDVAAGALIITEAGGLVGNFTGEADYMYQREVVAANPKIYGQLVRLLAPYTHVIKDAASGDAATGSGAMLTPETALAASVQADATAAAATTRRPEPARKVMISKARSDAAVGRRRAPR